MQLFPITLPKQHICNETALYYRTSDPVQYDETTGTITMHKNTVLSLDTYFNCFSYSKYLQYTHAKVLEVHMQVEGDVQLRMMKAELINGKIYRTEKAVQTVHHAQMDEAVLLYDFSKESGNGILYVEAKVLSAQAAVQFGHYASPVPAEQLNDTRLAAVICTYKREAYVKRNLNHLSATILADEELQQHIEIMVIDNGKTLQKDEIEQTNIKLYPNKNCGGSGGFTRGIIEALNRKDEFSHVLLMDDDILLESNVLVKNIRFLQILREEHTDLTLGGSMLRLDDMTVQHEAGGRWTGIRIQHGNHNIALTEVSSLLQNEALVSPQYNAWWYCCIPMRLIDENGFPLPFFIKVDDIEYGMRITKKLLVMNGIGIWHEPFENKRAPQLDYYDVRNKLTVNTLYTDNCLLPKNLFLVMRYMGKNMLKGNPQMAEFAVMGCKDYLKGIAYFKNVDLEQQHKQIGEQYKAVSDNKSHSNIYYWAADIVAYVQLAIQLILRTSTLKKQYRNEIEKITGKEYWINQLEIEA